MTARENLATLRTTMEQIAAEHRRLAILQVLGVLPSCSANDHIMRDCLDRLGHGVARDVLRADLDWLNEASLVRLELVDNLVVVKLKERGQDVAQGRVVVVDGIAKPPLP